MSPRSTDLWVVSVSASYQFEREILRSENGSNFWIERVKAGLKYLFALDFQSLHLLHGLFHPFLIIVSVDRVGQRLEMRLWRFRSLDISWSTHLGDLLLEN